jgi:type II secretory pathway component GspD/PulD (secretin)
MAGIFQHQGWQSWAVAVTLACGGLLQAARAADTATAPATTTTTTASAPATQADGRTHFESGDKIEGFYLAMSQRFGVSVLQGGEKEIKATILKPVDMPAKLDEAVDLLQHTLEAQGYGLVKTVTSSGHVLLRVTTAKDAQAAAIADSPVTMGLDTGKIDTSKPDRIVTHMLPVQHRDMADALRRTATQDKDVEATVSATADAGYTMILTGPAKKVRDAADAVLKIDKPDDSKVMVRTIPLHSIDAIHTAETLNADFAREQVAMKAVADRRTNSIILTGPEDRVLEAETTLTGMDKARPVRPAMPEIHLDDRPTTKP